MRLLTPPGVFRPRSDSWLLADAVRDGTRAGDRVTDICTGSGVVAISAALAGAGHVLAIDRSRRAVVTARVNGRLNGVHIEARRGDLLAPAAGQRFDLIASNPPYLPGTAEPARGAARAWEGGPDGRTFLDRLIAAAPAHLVPGGALLVIHSSVCGLDLTRERMRAARAPALEARGLLRPGEREEEIAILCATARAYRADAARSSRS